MLICNNKINFIQKHPGIASVAKWGIISGSAALAYAYLPRKISGLGAALALLAGYYGGPASAEGARNNPKDLGKQKGEQKVLRPVKENSFKSVESFPGTAIMAGCRIVVSTDGEIIGMLLEEMDLVGKDGSRSLYRGEDSLDCLTTEIGSIREQKEDAPVAVYVLGSGCRDDAQKQQLIDIARGEMSAWRRKNAERRIASAV